MTIPALNVRLPVTARTKTWTLTCCGATAITPCGRSNATVVSRSLVRPSIEIGPVLAVAMLARSAASPSSETTGTDRLTRATSKPSPRLPTIAGTIGTLAVVRSLKTTIVTRTDEGSTSTPRTGSPSSSTGVSGKSRSMSMPDVSTGTIARTCVTRAMSDWAPRTVAVWIDCTGGLTSRPSGTGPGTTTTCTSFGSIFSSLTDTKAGVADSTWIRGSADSTATRTDWFSGPGWTCARSTCALKLADVI